MGAGVHQVWGPHSSEVGDVHVGQQEAPFSLFLKPQKETADALTALSCSQSPPTAVSEGLPRGQLQLSGCSCSF